MHMIAIRSFSVITLLHVNKERGRATAQPLGILAKGPPLLEEALGSGNRNFLLCGVTDGLT